jgi:hypothetical protein
MNSMCERGAAGKVVSAGRFEPGGKKVVIFWEGALPPVVKKGVKPGGLWRFV